ncbi:CRISPR-associated RAMP protein, Cmr1 family [Caldicellulosiruptor obsidiansis OB47]|uniref:CRISPR-associated RAMP protein, Cmr1 family n=1 Tax=Caldicellulosiruptor obsidiansis (strain ATCC BAA-2073 / JCM 16842 / OB47) TaxID=608506 RepID=D9THD1_CALOO|nr:type III-B CRISPR module RAMP protein Cmr1 [Caldicellulosiruptor obsidiansis]ADL41496.1 CRISPR-associated RAMP protein, Cmr1 family [Caldicellulosiruptor obsidiansis OB47]
MREYNFHCEIVTPLYMCGSEKEKLELRSQSFNGLFRYWFRIGGGDLEDEKRIFGFGGNNGRKGLVQIIVEQTSNKDSYQRSEKLNFELKKGFDYLNYFLRKRENFCFQCGQQFKLTFRFSPLATEDDIKKFFCSVWLAMNLGNFGARARRGFGSVKVNKIDGSDEIFKFLEFIPTAPLKDWFNKNLNSIKSILFSKERESIPCLFNNSVEIYYLKKGNLEDSYKKWVSEIYKNKKKNKYMPHLKALDFELGNPLKALSFMGCLLMEFRNYYMPDYKNLISAIKNPLSAKNNGITIERSVFGLPLPFRIGNYNYSVDACYKQSQNSKSRRASPLWFKILLLNSPSNSSNSVECLFIVMKSDFLPNNMEILLNIQNNKNNENNEIKCSTNNWNAIDSFINTLKYCDLIDKLDF